MVKIWDPDEGRELERLECTVKVRSLAWSPRGERLATLDEDHELKIWDVSAHLRDHAPTNLPRGFPPPHPARSRRAGRWGRASDRRIIAVAPSCAVSAELYEPLGDPLVPLADTT